VTVYLDVIWLLNWLVDCLLLMMTGWILKQSIPRWRYVVGGFIGSLVILFSITPVSSYIQHPISKLFVSVLMVWFVFRFRRFTYFLKSLLTFYFTTFLFGGFLIGLHYFIQFDSSTEVSIYSSLSKGFGDPISWVFVMFGLPLAWYFTKSRIDHMEHIQIQYDRWVQVEVLLNGETFHWIGLIDSGNQLVDPISQSPVMIASIKGMEERFPADVVHLAKFPDDLLNSSITLPHEWEDRIRILPTKVVGNDQQLLIAYKVDYVKITTNDHQTFIPEKALVVLSTQQLSSDQTFHCIIHPKMVTGIPVSTAS
jgi:stage II sporulation protein GA (sporulation sigma-E factor processing peptidase)